ncbi:MAG: hypothetical protein U1D30_02180 [Planctomycetota bacterium]
MTPNILQILLLTAGVWLGEPGDQVATRATVFSSHATCKAPTCPDDYCKKTLPPSPCNVADPDPDTYCKKPLPRIHPCVTGKDPNCYSKKPLPRCLPPTQGAWHSCGPNDIPACDAKDACAKRPWCPWKW